MSDEYFHKAHELQAAGVPFATAVVVRAERPTSGKPGDHAIVTLEGKLYGWIGGSCARPTVLQAAARALADGKSRLIRLSPQPGSQPVPEGVEEVPMTCFSGGTLEIFIEPHQPAPHLLVVGNLPVARALARLGKAMDYRVTAVDAEGEDTGVGADEVLRDLADIPTRVDRLTFAVVATHGEYDEPALKAILATPAPYVALIASRTRGEAVVASLALDDVAEATRKRVRFPAGLDIGARKPDEIALSILAEIVQVRRGWTAEGAEDAEGDQIMSAEGVQAEGAEEVRAEGTTTRAAKPAPAGTAIDPVCQMTVQVEGALHTYEYEGQMYYFCCGGCRSRFAADPTKYLAAG